MKKFILALLLVTGNIFSNMAPEGFNRFPNYYFVETGTYRGQGIRFALRAGFTEIHSVEINSKFVAEARRTFARYSQVHIWEGDSGKILWDVIKEMDQPITFWLDGHVGFPFSNSTKKNTPLMEELEQIKMHPIKNHTIIIDDMHCCETLLFDYLSKEEIENKILEINPKYKIMYVDGGDKAEYKDNIMVAIVEVK